MRIVGLYADEAVELFSADQHVNIWDVISRCFHCEAQMSSLPEEVADDLESFFLEPTNEAGIPISLKVATSMKGIVENVRAD